jgi:membrane protease YdiL (CAAX protease family)
MLGSLSTVPGPRDGDLQALGGGGEARPERAGRGGPPLSPPEVPATPGDAAVWLFLGLVGFAVGQLLALLFVVLVAAGLGRLDQVARLTAAAEPPAWVVVAELVGLWIGFLGAVVLASRTRGTGRVARDMGLAMRPGDLVLGGAVGVACQLVLVPLLYLPLRAFVPHLDRRLSQPAKHLTGGFHGPELAVIGFLTVVVVPVVEELLFRGLVLRALLRLSAPAGRVLGPLLAVVGTGVLFGLAHAEPLELLGLAVLGMVLAVLAWRTGRLGPSMAAHGAFNLVAIVTLAYSTAGVPGLLR